MKHCLFLLCATCLVLGAGTVFVVKWVMSRNTGDERASAGDRGQEAVQDISFQARPDIIIEARDAFAGLSDAAERMEMMRRDPYLGEQIEAMTPIMEVPGALQFQHDGRRIVRNVKIVGLVPEKGFGGLGNYLANPDNRVQPSFELRADALKRRKETLFADEPKQPVPLFPEPFEKPPPDPPPSMADVPPGIIVGHYVAHYCKPSSQPGEQSKEVPLLLQGDDVVVVTFNGERLAPVSARFAVCDYFKSECSEVDANYVLVSLDYLQRLRNMENRATSIQIKLKDSRNAKEVAERVRKLQFTDEQGQPHPVFSSDVSAVMTADDTHFPWHGGIK